MYFWEATQGTAFHLRSAALDGSSIKTVLSPNNVTTTALAVDDAYIYWALVVKQEGVLRRTTLAGGATTDVVTSEYGVTGLATDSSFVYWSTLDRAQFVGGQILRAPLNGSDVAVLADDQRLARHLTIDTNNAYWVSKELYTDALLWVPK